MSSFPVPPRLADVLSQPINARQYFSLFAACIVVFGGFSYMILALIFPHDVSRYTFFPQYGKIPYILYATGIIAFSLWTPWLMEVKGHPLLRYAIRKL